MPCEEPAKNDVTKTLFYRFTIVNNVHKMLL